MSQAQFQIPLITPVAGQLITAQLWINEFLNLQANLNPLGLGGYSDTDTQMQLQTAPYPGLVTSHASSIAGELERLRYQLAALTGNTYWYQAPAISIASAANVLLPIGGVIDYPSATPPNANFLLANGQAISRTVYATLFSLVGTTFGIGDGSTTFNIPNYTNRSQITAGDLYSLGATGGEATHTLTSGEMPSHTHTATSTVTDPGHLHLIAHNAILPAGFVSGGTNLISTNGTGAGDENTASATTGATVATTNANTGGGGSHNNLPPYLSMYKLMRVL